MAAIQKIGPNQREVRGTCDVSGKAVSVLVSYQTPVAVQYAGGQVYHTEEKHSATTTKHIKAWLAGRQNGGTVRQAELDDILKGLVGRNRLD